MVEIVSPHTGTYLQGRYEVDPDSNELFVKKLDDDVCTGVK